MMHFLANLSVADADTIDDLSKDAPWSFAPVANVYGHMTRVTNGDAIEAKMIRNLPARCERVYAGELPRFDSYFDVFCFLYRDLYAPYRGMAVFAAFKAMGELSVLKNAIEECVGSELTGEPTGYFWKDGKAWPMHSARIKPAIKVGFGRTRDVYWEQEIERCFPTPTCSVCKKKSRHGSVIEKFCFAKPNFHFGEAYVCGVRCGAEAERKSLRNSKWLVRKMRQDSRELSKVEKVRKQLSRLRAALKDNDLPALKLLQEEFGHLATSRR